MQYVITATSCGEALTAFFDAISNDPCIDTGHISIYAALLARVHELRQSHVIAFGRDIMRQAKISGSATWHKKIRELHDYGYICYMPSFKKNQGSKIYLPAR